MKTNTISHLQNGLIALAIIFTGIMAGFFYAYTFNVNLAMSLVDGETYATVQSLFNENVRHVGFFAFFFGSAAISLGATIVHARQWKSPTFWLLASATIIYIGGIIIFTRQVNLPLNYYTESWDPTNLPLDWEATRDAWNRANAFRVGTSLTSFALCIMAMMSQTYARK